MSAQPLSAPEIDLQEIPRLKNAESVVLNLKAGDVVVVRSPQEIAETLDENGTLDSLPFMPEMLEYCGKQFKVLNRVVQTTIDGAFLGGHTESYVREFRNNDVVTLQSVRCSGAPHDNCQRACAIFWKEAWLRKADDLVEVSEPDSPSFSSSERLSLHLKTTTQPGKYFCQSSEFLKATLHLSMAKRIRKCFSAMAARNISVWGMTKRLIAWAWWRTHYKLIGESVRGSLEKTPIGVLDLKPGDLVQIKSLPEIKATLNKTGRNRGLHFSADQRPFCGRQFRVRNRADNFIAEGTGEMKHFQNTVMLEDVLCDSACFAFGGCYRSDLLYWREIWLRKI